MCIRVRWFRDGGKSVYGLGMCRIIGWGRGDIIFCRTVVGEFPISLLKVFTRSLNDTGVRGRKRSICG